MAGAAGPLFALAPPEDCEPLFPCDSAPLACACEDLPFSEIASLFAGALLLSLPAPPLSFAPAAGQCGSASGVAAEIERARRRALARYLHASRTQIAARGRGKDSACEREGIIADYRGRASIAQCDALLHSSKMSRKPLAPLAAERQHSEDELTL